MKCASGVLAIFAAASLLLGYPADKKSTNHPPDPKGSPRADLDEATSKLAAQFPRLGGPPIGPIPRNNYIDDYIFGKMERDNIPHAQLSSDEEFLRRVFLDLTGRLPEPDRVRSFVEESDPDKRYKLIDELTDAKVDPGGGGHPSFPYLDRWTYFFSDLFRNASAELGVKGRNLFWDYIHTALLLRVPYNELVTEMLTATTRSNWESPKSNYLARMHTDDADGLGINHEDTIEDIAVRSSRNFLGVNLDCVSCHDGAGHLEKINLWLSRTAPGKAQFKTAREELRVARPRGIVAGSPRACRPCRGEGTAGDWGRSV